MKPKTTKCGEIFRSTHGTYNFICYHCGDEFDTTLDILNHIEIHYADLVPSGNFLTILENNIKCEIASGEDPPSLVKLESQLGEGNIEIKSEEDSNNDDGENVEDDHQFHQEDIFFETAINESRCNSPSNKLAQAETTSANFEKPEQTDKNNIEYNSKTHFLCKVCMKPITFKYRDMHLAKHADLKPFKCKLCSKSYNSSRALVRHGRVHMDGFQLPTCDYCKREFRTKSELANHILVHSIDKPFNCQICNRGFPKKELFNNHMRIHGTERPYQCSVCGLAFVSAGTLNSHSMRHNEKKHKCNMCDRAYYKKYQLTEHKLIHAGIRTVSCTICEKTFLSRKVMLQHRRLHDTEKRYKCKFCDMTFAQSSGRRGHEKFKHGFV